MPFLFLDRQRASNSLTSSDTSLEEQGHAIKEHKFKGRKRSPLQSRSTQSASVCTTNPPNSFSIHGLPTPAEIVQASYLQVFTQDGSTIPFGTILSHTSSPMKKRVKTIVCFIRHFMCPLCQDYMYSIVRNVSPEVLEQAGLRLVIVGNGAWQMIKGYQRIFKLPYPIYTDPTAALYAALGMTLRTLDAGPKPSSSSSSSSSPSQPDISVSGSQPKTYVRHDNLLSGISLVMLNAIKARMPLWRYMGDKALLGGEFIFEKAPGKDLTCVWAHRMRYTTAHEEIADVVGEAQQTCTDVDSCCEEIMMPMTASTTSTGISSSSEQILTPTNLVMFDSPPTSHVPENEVSSVNESTDTLTSRKTWKVARDRELWLMGEKKRWRRLIGLIGERETVDSDLSESE